MYADAGRRISGRRAPLADLARYAWNRALVPLERRLAESYGDVARPVVLIVGVPRSGTTLVHQLCAAHLDVGYISNRIARWWMAPVWATLRQRRRAGNEPLSAELLSDLGRTRGEQAPHEFGWFWTHHLPCLTSDHLFDHELASCDVVSLRRELQGLVGVWQRPLVLKNLNHTAYQIEWLQRVIPNLRFIHVRREPVFAAQSILQARIQRYGSEDVWWSIRPRDVEAWLEKPALEQVCHQVRDVSAAIDRGLAAIPEAQRHVIDYETLVARPAETLHALTAFIGTDLLDEERTESLSLKSANQRRLPAERFAKLEAALG